MSVEVTIVIPAFNESESISELIRRILVTLNKIGINKKYEILYVNDGSSDNTSSILEKLNAPFLKEIKLSQNTGKSIALMAGFFHASGKYIVTIDADLQDRPEDIPKLLNQLNKGFDLVTGWRIKREDKVIRKIGSRIYNRFLQRITGLEIHDQNCGLKIYKKNVIDKLILYGHLHRFILYQASLLGFKVSEVPVGNDRRKFGYSKYKTFRYKAFFDFISLFFTYRYAMTPLHFFGLISLIIFIPGFLIILWLLIEHIGYLFNLGNFTQLVDRPLLFIGIALILSGISTFMTGLICDFVLFQHTRINMTKTLNNFIEKN